LKRLPLVVDTGGVGGGFSLPAGTVTFLLTDIESSTRYWEADAAAMAPAVARHYELLDQAVTEDGGIRPVEQARATASWPPSPRPPTRLTCSIPEPTIAELRTEHGAAWSEGARLTLEEATALAQRSRGPRGRPSFGFEALTPTETLVVQHVRQGQTNAEIAKELLVSVPTVKTHLTRIFTKLGVRNRAELASLAAESKRQ
jgi:DNA-binding CsgD family transcriptional regulator